MGSPESRLLVLAQDAAAIINEHPVQGRTRLMRLFTQELESEARSGMFAAQLFETHSRHPGWSQRVLDTRNESLRLLRLK